MYLAGHLSDTLWALLLNASDFLFCCRWIPLHTTMPVSMTPVPVTLVETASVSARPSPRTLPRVIQLGFVSTGGPLISAVSTSASPDNLHTFVYMYLAVLQ